MKKILAFGLGVLCLVGCSAGATPSTQVEVTPKTSIQIEQEKIEVDPIDAYMAQMTLEEKVGQLFMIAIRQDSAGLPVTTVNEAVKALLDTIPVGGVVLFSENIQSTEQVSTLIEELQAQSQIPLWIGVDEEGGRVSRVSSNPAICDTPFKNALELNGDTQLAYDEAKRMGNLLDGLGFNLDFAPVGDIYNNPENQVIGKRSFGKSEEEVTPMVEAFAKGLADTGIVPVIKHFPGHGNTREDSHNGLAYVNKSLEELEAQELVPFREATEEVGIPMMMIGHLVVPAVDPNHPATLSKVWGDYVANHFPEDLLTITDAMEMGAITSHYGTAESAVQVITSGYDMILMPLSLQEAYEGVLDACREGVISQARLDRSVRKILSKKVEHQLPGMNILILEE